MTELQIAGLYPVPLSPEAMHESIVSYWSKIKNLGTPHKQWFPVTLKNSYSSGCNFKYCLGDFAIVNKTKKTLKECTSAEIWKQWEAVSS
jgi:hypothetical protein